MLLGGTVAGAFSGPKEWEALLIASRFKAVTAPFNCHTPRAEIDAYCDIAARHHVKIAELGIWKNLFDPDPAAAAQNLDYAKRQLALAEEVNIPCAVNISGSVSPIWDGAAPGNYAPETYDRIVDSIREILDDVRPTRAFYTLEPMSWMIPDGPDVYLQLIRDVDRPQFAAHMDFINMINCPRRYLAPEAFIEECFQKLGPHIKSTHIKDTRMDPHRLTTLIQECSPGEGTLDYARVLAILNKYLAADAPVLLEHMQTFEEYRVSYDYVAGKAAQAGIPV